MCELFGISSDLPATLSLSLVKLAEHSGPPVLNGDGWGVGYFEGTDVRLFKDAAPAHDSDWVRFIRDHDLHSRIVIAHTRKATMGERAYRNAQPFVRELAGRMHLFAHNGWLPGILASPRFGSRRYSSVGETDSERAFCALLDRMRDVWRRPGDISSLEARLSVVSSFAAELRPLGPANFLYSDGDTLFAHGDRRRQAATSRVEPPGLVFLQRWCRRQGQGFVASGIRIEGADQVSTLVASVPLTDDPWQALAEGEVIAVLKGQIILPRRPRPEEPCAATREGDAGVSAGMRAG
jgi:glutamine amidotransferase